MVGLRKNLKLLNILAISSFLIATSSYGKNDFEIMANKMASKFHAPVIRLQDFKQEVSKGKAIILDAREIHEFNVSHIPKAKYVGFDHINMDKLVEVLPKNKKIIVYCSVGYRSGKIADKLIAKGFNVYNLHGGIFGWANKGNLLVDKKEIKTEAIHGYNIVYLYDFNTRLTTSHSSLLLHI